MTGLIDGVMRIFGADYSLYLLAQLTLIVHLIFILIFLARIIGYLLRVILKYFLLALTFHGVLLICCEIVCGPF
jgi:hypothetical protein